MMNLKIFETTTFFTGMSFAKKMLSYRLISRNTTREWFPMRTIFTFQVFALPISFAFLGTKYTRGRFVVREFFSAHFARKYLFRIRLTSGIANNSISAFSGTSTSGSRYLRGIFNRNGKRLRANDTNFIYIHT